MCGFCTPGFVMASVGAAREASRRRRPSRFDARPRRQHLPLRHVLAHLRSGVEREGGDAVARPEAAAGAGRARRPGRQQQQPPPPPADPKYALARRSGPCSARRSSGSTARTRSRGRAKYTFDINRPGMLYGRIVRSPHPHARIVSIDLDRGAEGAGRQGGARLERSGNPQRNTVMFQGDEVAAVAADTEERAIDAARLVKVEYEVLPHVIRRRSGARRQRAGGVHERQRAAGRDPGDRRSRRRLQAGGAHRRGDLLDARHHARVPRVARRGLRVGRRQADRLGLDAGRSAPRATASPAASAFRRPTCA